MDSKAEVYDENKLFEFDLRLTKNVNGFTPAEIVLALKSILQKKMEDEGFTTAVSISRVALSFAFASRKGSESVCPKSIQLCMTIPELIINGKLNGKFFYNLGHMLQSVDNVTRTSAAWRSKISAMSIWNSADFTKLSGDRAVALRVLSQTPFTDDDRLFTRRFFAMFVNEYITSAQKAKIVISTELVSEWANNLAGFASLKLFKTTA